MEARTSTVHLESKDPWRGHEMRLPIGVMAKFEIKEPESVLAQGWWLFIEGLLKGGRGHAVSHQHLIV